jgi:hypothetical protein
MKLRTLGMVLVSATLGWVILFAYGAMMSGWAVGSLLGAISGQGTHAPWWISAEAQVGIPLATLALQLVGTTWSVGRGQRVVGIMLPVLVDVGVIGGFALLRAHRRGDHEARWEASQRADADARTTYDVRRAVAPTLVVAGLTVAPLEGQDPAATWAGVLGAADDVGHCLVGELASGQHVELALELVVDPASPSWIERATVTSPSPAAGFDRCVARELGLVHVPPPRTPRAPIRVRLAITAP